MANNWQNRIIDATIRAALHKANRVGRIHTVSVLTGISEHKLYKIMESQEPLSDKERESIGPYIEV